MMTAKWRWALLTVLALAGTVTAAPVPDERDTASHLAIVPVDAPGFVTFDFTGYWDEDVVKDLLKKFEESGKTSILKDLEKELGIDVKQLARLTLIMPPTLGNEDAPVVVFSTVKPFDKDKITKALTPEGKEKKSTSGKAYIETKTNAVHFIDDRTFLVSEPKSMAAYLDKKLGGSDRIPKATELVAKNKFVALVDVSDYGKTLIEHFPPLKGADALADAKPALLTVKGEKELSLTLNLTYADDEQSQKGQKAARIALDQLGQLIADGQKDLAKQMERPDIKQDPLAQWGLKQSAAMLKEFDDNVKKVDLAQKGKEVTVSMRSKISPAQLLTLMVGMVMPAERVEQGSSEVPPDPKKSSPVKFAEPTAPANLLEKNGRLAIVGDSITEQKLYSKYMEAYILACAGRRDVHVFQYGWSGETAGGFNGRVENDLPVLKPTVVTLCYGMNDGQYRPYDENSVGAPYEKNMRAVLKKLDGMGIKNIVAGSPGAVDTRYFKNNNNFRDKNPAEGYNDSLAHLGEIDKKLAEELHLTHADVHAAMIDAMSKAKAGLGEDYDVCGKDGVHPHANGQLIMAYAFLKSLGLDGDIGDIVIDMKGEATGSEGHKILEAKGGKVEISSERYPFCFDADAKSSESTRSILPYLPFNQDLNRFTLKVKNLSGDKANVTWGGETKEFTREQLDSGINLAAEFSKTPFDAAFQKVLKAIEAKQNYETPAIKQWMTSIRWANSEFKDDDEMGAAMTIVRARILARDKQMREAVLKALEPVKHTITIE